MKDQQTRILKSPTDLVGTHIRALYDGFNSSIASLDCGRKCAPHNPNGKPFCCDICHAVPTAYKSEWCHFQQNTNLWHVWRGDECGDGSQAGHVSLRDETPRDMILLACLGPALCQRNYRALSCRQFPFFPYVTSEYRFIGLAYEWEFENKCWVISNLSRVTQKYRREFVCTYDHLFAWFQSEFENYAYHSEKMRGEFVKQRRRIPILHRNGKTYLISPKSERMRLVSPANLPKFGLYHP